MARHNRWTDEQCLQDLYFSLEGTWRHWFENREALTTLWDTCVLELKQTLASQSRRQRPEDLLQTRTQGPNERITSFVEAVLRMYARADPQATGEKKLHLLMMGVKSDIFGGLVRYPPTTVEEFVAEVTNIELALTVRAGNYNRPAGSVLVSTFTSTELEIGGVGVSNLSEIIRNIVPEELKKLQPAVDVSASLSVAKVVRERAERALAGCSR